jgi:hypothetical protein
MLCECLIYCVFVFVLKKALNQTDEKRCVQHKRVSTYKLEAITINRLNEIPAANNIANL